MFSGQHKHFYHRAGFGVGVDELRMGETTPLKQMIEEALQKGIEKLPISQVVPQGSPSQSATFLEDLENPRFQKMEGTATQLDNLRFEWFEEMRTNSATLREKMTLFWHGHFACQCLQESTARDYLFTLRKHALGDFRTLLLEMSKTPAMILFLNNQQNKKDHPNENFARELMELFTLGRGSYTEKDVKEAARAFTGWSTDEKGSFLIRASNHDTGFKTFLDKKGRFNGDDIIEMLLDHPSTPIHLAKALYRFFVNDVYEIEAVQSIAQQILSSRFNMAEVMGFILNSDFFFSQANRGNKIKSPVDLLLQVCRLFNIKFVDRWGVTFLQRAMGQVLFDPPDVAGWPGGKAWINNSTLMLRLNLAMYLVNNERFDHAVATPYEAMSANQSVQNIRVEKDLYPLLDLFSGTPYSAIGQKAKDSILATSSRVSLTERREMRDPGFAQKTLLRLVSLPEFQLC